MDDLRAYTSYLSNTGNGCYFVFFSLCPSDEKDFQGEKRMEAKEWKRRRREEEEKKKKKKRREKVPFDQKAIWLVSYLWVRSSKILNASSSNACVLQTRKQILT